MEIRSPITAIFFIILLFISCVSSKGGSENAMDSDSEVYEIDYRGPETHSSQLSPPDHSHGRPWIHQQNKPKGFRGGPKEAKATKIHE